jgi:uncharacterized protein (DUF2236 family)
MNHSQSRAREDWGLFGPRSPTWRIWSSPTALLAFRRSIIVETFDPFLAIAVHEQNAVRNDPHGRFERTLRYFLTVACGDSRSALEASQLLMRVHARAHGTEPISGKRYSANDPTTQLWIHVTGWHSNLLCYERFGGGPLSAKDEAEYWDNCVTAAELQTCNPKDVPRSRDEVRQYYAAVRSRLCMSEHGRSLIHYFLKPPRRVVGASGWALGHVLAPAVLSTIPRWMRVLAGMDQSRATDRAIVPVVRGLVRLGSRPEIVRSILRETAPSVLPLMEEVLTMAKPQHDEVPSIAQARERLAERMPPALATAS